MIQAASGIQVTVCHTYGALFDLERGKNFNDLLEAYKDEKRKF